MRAPAGSEALERALDAHRPGEIDRVEGPGWQAEVHAVEVDRIGVVVDRLRVVGAPGELAARAGRLAEALRPGGERLDAVEVDAGLGGAVLRTRPEDMRGGRFYEVQLAPDHAELTRQVVRPGGGRAPAPFAVTREELGRIVEDLGRILAEVPDEG